MTQIHGVGRWMVEMLLVVTFNRTDVFSTDDVGIQNTMRQLYKLNQNGIALNKGCSRSPKPGDRIVSSFVNICGDGRRSVIYRDYTHLYLNSQDDG